MVARNCSRIAFLTLIISIASSSSLAQSNGPEKNLISEVKLDESRVGLIHKNESYRTSLLEMVKVDQNLRKEFKLLVGGVNMQKAVNENSELKTFALKIHANQIENESALKNLIKKFGFPDFSLVGEDGANAAFLLAQHSRDGKFRNEFCEQAKILSKDGKFSTLDVAYLTDRNLMMDGKPQLYGTQRKSDGTLYEVEQPDQLSNRRLSVGLPID